MKTSYTNIVIITSYVEHPFDMKAALSALSEPFVICTDGGYDIASSQGISPDLLLGDFDSIKSEMPPDIQRMEFPPEKDYTDLELAIRTAMDLNAENVEIWGGTGGRLDHTVGNIRILEQYSPYFTRLVMMDGRNRCFVLHRDVSGSGPDIASPKRPLPIPAHPGAYLSLFPLRGSCDGLTISGVKYPLQGVTLTAALPDSVTLSVSNEFTEKEALLSFEKGSLLVVISES